MSEKDTRDALRLRSKTMVKTFIQTLHSTWLKPTGLRKSGHTFRREFDLALIEYQIQGSSWNGPPPGPLILSPWRPTWLFYVNVTVNLKPPGRTEGFPDASWRLNEVLPEADRAWELREDNIDELAEQLAVLIKRADVRLQERAKSHRESGNGADFTEI